MKETTRWIMTCLCAAALSGCAVAQKHKSYAAASAPMAERSTDTDASENDSSEVRPDRMLIWKADLTLQVENVAAAVREATVMTEQQGGFVEKKSDQGDESACMTLRIPSKKLKTAVSSLECLGKVTHRNLEGEDVTAQYVDVEARLKNKILLRDRLKFHLDKATDVKDIVAIEKELNRVQSDIDSMQGQIKALKGNVDYATIVLSVERKTILGPLGYFFKGIWWGVEKLFVIRE